MSEAYAYDYITKGDITMKRLFLLLLASIFTSYLTGCAGKSDDDIKNIADEINNTTFGNLIIQVNSYPCSRTYDVEISSGDSASIGRNQSRSFSLPYGSYTISGVFRQFCSGTVMQVFPINSQTVFINQETITINL